MRHKYHALPTHKQRAPGTQATPKLNVKVIAPIISARMLVTENHNIAPTAQHKTDPKQHPTNVVTTNLTSHLGKTLLAQRPIPTRLTHEPQSTKIRPKSWAKAPPLSLKPKPKNLTSTYMTRSHNHFNDISRQLSKKQNYLVKS
eukprot:gene13074-8920_t